MTEQEERKFEKFEEKYFKSHREIPNGRDYRFNRDRHSLNDDAYKKNFDLIFPHAPGAGIQSTQAYPTKFNNRLRDVKRSLL